MPKSEMKNPLLDQGLQTKLKELKETIKALAKADGLEMKNVMLYAEMEEPNGRIGSFFDAQCCSCENCLDRAAANFFGYLSKMAAEDATEGTSVVH